MTIMIRSNDPVQLRNYGQLLPATPSQVWDVEPATGERAGVSVRTLPTLPRTSVRGRCASSGTAVTAGTAFESGPAEARSGQGWREQRDNLALGAMMAAALLVGSTFGGAFSAAGAGSAPQPASAQGTAVHYAR